MDRTDTGSGEKCEKFVVDRTDMDSGENYDLCVCVCLWWTELA